MTLLEWLQRGTGIYKVDGDLYLGSTMRKGLVIGRGNSMNLERVTRDVRRALGELETDAAARQALIEMYDDAFPPVLDFAARLDVELCAPCPCGSGASSLLCGCLGQVP